MSAAGPLIALAAALAVLSLRIYRALCGRKQHQHRDLASNPPAGDCPFVPAGKGNA